MTELIRQIETSDIEGFHTALSSVAAEQWYILTLVPPSLEKIRGFIESNIQKNYPHYVCVLNNEIVGWADITPSPRQTMHHAGGLGMGLIKSQRGKGFGKKLLQKAIDHAWSIGLKRLELEVFTDNDVAIKLYKSAGFNEEGVKKNARFHQGRFQDICIMAQCRI